MCNHIIGIGDGVDEWWYIYVDTDKDKKEYKDWQEEFKYCPKCGVELENE